MWVCMPPRKAPQSTVRMLCLCNKAHRCKRQRMPAVTNQEGSLINNAVLPPCCVAAGASPCLEAVAPLCIGAWQSSASCRGHQRIAMRARCGSTGVSPALMAGPPCTAAAVTGRAVPLHRDPRMQAHGEAGQPCRHALRQCSDMTAVPRIPTRTPFPQVSTVVEVLLIDRCALGGWHGVPKAVVARSVLCSTPP